METAEDRIIEFVCTNSGSEYFDEIVGHIEEIIMSESFQKHHHDFLESTYKSFKNTEEHSVENYMVFQKYSALFEEYIFGELKKILPDFDMSRFEQEISKNVAADDYFKNCEIYELLLTFTDFEKFNELMLDYRHEKEGKFPDFNSSIVITRGPNIEQESKSIENMATD